MADSSSHFRGVSLLDRWVIRLGLAVEWAEQAGALFKEQNGEIRPQMRDAMDQIRQLKLLQFDVSQTGLIDPWELPIISGKESDLVTWKRLEESLEESRQKEETHFAEQKNEAMQRAYALHQEYGVGKGAMKVFWRIEGGGQVSRADLDNFDRDFRLMDEGYLLERHGITLDLDRRNLSVPAQIERGERASLKIWAASYLDNVRQPDAALRLPALAERTLRLQQNNEIPLPRFEKALRDAHASREEQAAFAASTASLAKAASLRDAGLVRSGAEARSQTPFQVQSK